MNPEHRQFLAAKAAEECDAWMMEHEGRHCANPADHYEGANAVVKFDEAAEFVRSLARGDRATFKQGYSLGNALIAAAERFNLSADEVAVIVDQVAYANFDTNGPSSPPSLLRPLVVIGVGGGLVQWHVSHSGNGSPEVFVLDFDREGATPDEVKELIATIEAAITAIEARPPNSDTHLVVANLRLSVEEYTRHSELGLSPSRYR